MINYLIFIFILLVFTVLILYLTKDIDKKYRKIINTGVYICVTALDTMVISVLLSNYK